jgi:hypothetical protein
MKLIRPGKSANAVGVEWVEEIPLRTTGRSRSTMSRLGFHASWCLTCGPRRVRDEAPVIINGVVASVGGVGHPNASGAPIPDGHGGEVARRKPMGGARSG